MAKGDRFADPVSEAFRRVSQDARARREAGIPPADEGPMDRVMVALFVLVFVLVVLGIALPADWLPGVTRPELTSPFL
jgi:hypothetical protein